MKELGKFLIPNSLENHFRGSASESKEKEIRLSK